MHIRKVYFILFVAFIIATQPSCKKYLTAKPDKALAVPSALQDLQALLDDFIDVNSNDAAATVQSVDDFYVTDNDYNTISDNQARQLYTWGTEAVFASFPNDWSYEYDKVNIANTILDNLDAIERTAANATEWDNVKGQALLLRARSFQIIAWIWAKAYDPSTASTDLGIPLRLHADFNIPSVRATLRETYDRIISDYKQCIPLLPQTPVHVLRASKPAAYALLARTYLSMRDYDNCGLYTDSCLNLFSYLLDYNSLNASASYPVKRYNNEVIMDERISVPNLFVGTKAKIDTLLYQSYTASDLRKTIFFKNNNGFYTFKGSYEGVSAMFSGIATDEVILMKAECLARKDNTNGAMDALNSLLVTRWKSGYFVPLTAVDANNALAIILQERRKELIRRGLRWMDIKRLNKEGAGITMKRTVEGKMYSIVPNSPRYAFPIPDDIIRFTGMEQNPK
jgi:hypothetical protein